MDIFQVLTLCFLLSVMFLGVLSYGLYRNWQRNQLELIRVPSGPDEFSDLAETPERIYPRVNVSEPNSSSNPLQGPSVTLGTSSRKEPMVSSDDHVQSSGKGHDSQDAGRGDRTEIKKPRHLECDLTAKPEFDKGKQRSRLVQEKLDLHSSGDPTTSEQSTAEGDGLDQFREPRKETSTKVAKTKVSRKSSLSTRKGSRLERKPPLRSKRKEGNGDGASGSSMPHSDLAGRNSSTEFILLSVVGEHDTSFRMNELSRFLLSRGMVVDDLGLFCMRDQETGEILFKIADVFHPGTFDVKTFDTYRTAGISLVMRPPNVNNARDVFEQMLSLANECAATFSGAVKDENYNAMSNQTLAHYRQRVSEFRRKQLTMYA